MSFPVIPHEHVQTSDYNIPKVVVKRYVPDDTHELLDLVRIIRKIEEVKESTIPYSEDFLLAKELEQAYQQSNEFSQSLQIVTPTPIRDPTINVWNALFALRKANRQLISAKQARKYIIHELDNIALSLKDDDKNKFYKSDRREQTSFNENLNRQPKALSQEHQTDLDEDQQTDNVVESNLIKNFNIPEMEKEVTTAKEEIEKNESDTDKSKTNLNNESQMTTNPDYLDFDATVNTDSTENSFTYEYDPPLVFPGTEKIKSGTVILTTLNSLETTSLDHFFTETEANTKAAAETESEMTLSHKIDSEESTLSTTTTTKVVVDDSDFDIGHYFETDNSETSKMTETTTKANIFKPDSEEITTTLPIVTEQTYINYKTNSENRNTSPEEVENSQVSENDPTQEEYKGEFNSPTLAIVDHHFETTDSQDAATTEVDSREWVVTYSDDAQESTSHSVEELSTTQLEETTTPRLNFPIKVKSKNRISDSNELFHSESSDEFTTTQATFHNTSDVDTTISSPLTTTSMDEVHQQHSDMTTTERTDGESTSYTPTESDIEVVIPSEETFKAPVSSILIPRPVLVDSDDLDRIIYPESSESIEELFVGDESMNLPNYLDYVDPPKQVS